MLRILVSVLAAISVQGLAYAGNDQIKRGPAPAWVLPSDLMSVPVDPSGLVFVRRQDVLVHLGSSGQDQYLGYRIKILHANALQIGNVAISWSPVSGMPTAHVVKIYRDGSVIDVLQSASFEIIRREDQLEAARLDGNLTGVLRVPDLRIGDELEVGLTIPMGDPSLANHEAGSLMIGPDPAPGRYRLGLQWEKGFEPALKITPDIAPMALRREGKVEFRFDNPTVLTPPKDAPARFQWQRTIEYSDFADWAAVSRHFAPLFGNAATLTANSPLKGEASRIAAGHNDALGRAEAALKLVQQDVRYIYVGLNGGNLTPATADETWQRRYGDCKGKTALLLALLAELGIEAEPVLVNSSGTDDGLDERLPSPRMFDHVLVRARIGGVNYWLDGTMPPVVSPSVKPTLPYKWVLPLTPQGGSIEHLGWEPAKRPDQITMYEIDARAGFDQPAKVINTSITRGVSGLQQQVQLSGIASGQLLSGFRQNLIGNSWQTIDSVDWRYDQKAEASVLKINGTMKIDWDDDGDGAHSFALPGGGFNPPDRRGRSTEQQQDAPFYNKPEFDCQVTTMRLPSSTRSRQWASKPGYDIHVFGKNYYRALALRDGAIRMVRGLRVERDEIDAATARRDNGRIMAFDNSMAWIFYDPAGQVDPVSDAPNVPATYEIDWTADTVPCLAGTENRPVGDLAAKAKSAN